MKVFFKKIKPSTYLHIGLLAILFLFLVLPLIVMLFKANGSDINYVFHHAKLGSAILNSFLYSLVGAVISIVLATIVAYFLTRANIKGKKWYILAITLPMLIPTLSIGLGIKNLFGAGGLLDLLFHIRISNKGFLPVTIGAVVFTFPVSFLLIYDSLLYEDKSVYDAANTLGIKRFKSFLGITLPYLKTTLISAFFASFTLIFADYGLPTEVAGSKFHTLPVFLIEEFNANPLGGRTAVISLFLLMPAIAAFIVDICNKEQTGGVASKSIINPTKRFNITAIVVSVLTAVILFIPQFVFLMISFVKRFPSDMTFTFEHYSNAFSPYASVSAGTFLTNSLIISLMAGLFGTAFAYLTGYAAVRTKGKLKKVIHLVAISTLAVPGLVLGLGFVYLFKDTSGWFAETIIILVVVNIIHYFSSPYLMAKNAFEKINKDYETVGDTLGISRFSLFFKVMIPNSVSTIVSMFSYFFINSMITISAVSLLIFNSPDLTPLSVSINTYEQQGQYENQAVVSAIILLVNIVAKVGFDTLNSFLKKMNKKERMGKDMSLTRFQFNVLTYIDEHLKEPLTQRQIADGVTLSLGTTNKIINEFIEDEVIHIANDKSIKITDLGYKLLEPFKVRKAVIIAAGFGSRLAPVTLDTPKPLVKVNGVRIIDTLLDALYAKDITNITIVVGYKKEQFQQLLEKYPTLKFIENPIYNESNNISSIFAAKDILDRCYICEADLIVSNPAVITKYQYASNYLGAYVSETDDWCFFKKKNYIDRVSIGGEDCWHMIGISYWNEADSAKLREDVVKAFNSRGGRERYWDNVPLTIYKKDFKIEIRDCKKSDVTEIDNYSELVIIDPSYKDYEQRN